MESTARSSAPALIEELTQNAAEFEFFQSVRLLRFYLAQRGVPEERHFDAIHFRSDVGLDFPASELKTLTQRLSTDSELQDTFELCCRFLGVISHSGILPDHYLQWQQEERRAGNASLGDFFDLFNHRLIQLFYQCWERSRLIAGLERSGQSPLMDALVGLMGPMHNQEAAARQLPSDFLVRYSGLLGRLPVSRENLHQMLTEYLQLNGLEIQECFPCRVTLDESSRFQLGNEESGCQLGNFCPLGETVWDVESRVHLVIQTRDEADFQSLQPDAPRGLLLFRIFQCVTGGELELSVTLNRPTLVDWYLGDDAQSHYPSLGIGYALGGQGSQVRSVHLQNYSASLL